MHFAGKKCILLIIDAVVASGKGDLVGCDISRHLTAAKEGHGGASAAHSAAAEVLVKSSCDVRALTYCDLKCLHIPGLVEVMRLYPEFQDQFAEDILHDLTFNLRDGWEADVSVSIVILATWTFLFDMLLFMYYSINFCVKFSSRSSVNLR